MNKAHCTICGSETHLAWNCSAKAQPKRAKSSPNPGDGVVHDQVVLETAPGRLKTASRKDEKDTRTRVASGGVRQSTGSFTGASRSAEPAGTQALPVDTNSLPSWQASSGDSVGGIPLEQASPTKFNKQEWQKLYMREYRKGKRRRVTE